LGAETRKVKCQMKGCVAEVKVSDWWTCGPCRLVILSRDRLGMADYRYMWM